MGKYDAKVSFNTTSEEKAIESYNNNKDNKIFFIEVGDKYIACSYEEAKVIQECMNNIVKKFEQSI